MQLLRQTIFSDQPLSKSEKAGLLLGGGLIAGGVTGASVLGQRSLKKLLGTERGAKLTGKVGKYLAGHHGKNAAIGLGLAGGIALANRAVKGASSEKNLRKKR